MKSLLKAALEKNSQFKAKADEHELKSIFTSSLYQNLYSDQLTHIYWHALLQQRRDTLFLATNDKTENCIFEKDLNIKGSRPLSNYEDEAEQEIHLIPEHQAVHPIDGFDVISLLKSLPNLDAYKELTFFDAIELLELEQRKTPNKVSANNIFCFNHRASLDKLTAELESRVTKLRKKTGYEHSTLVTETKIKVDKLKSNLVIPFLDLLIYANTYKIRLTTTPYTNLLNYIYSDLSIKKSSLNKTLVFRKEVFQTKDLESCKKITDAALSNDFLEALLRKDTNKKQ